jgi:hypothetical protein
VNTTSNALYGIWRRVVEEYDSYTRTHGVSDPAEHFQRMMRAAGTGTLHEAFFITLFAQGIYSSEWIPMGTDGSR